jgi:amphi-Trp domain-containing protein
MSSDNNDFKHESLQDCDTIVKYLNAISEGFRQGHLVLANGDAPIVLEPDGLLKLDLKAKKKDGRYKLSMKISWKEKEQVESKDDKPLIIGKKRS